MSRHVYRRDESYRGVPASCPRSTSPEPGRRMAILVVVPATLFAAAVLGGWMVLGYRPFWSQPDVRVAIAVRWSRYRPDRVGVDVVDAGPIALQSIGFGAVCGFIVWLSVRAERRRQQRRRSGIYLVREEPRT